MAARVMMLSKPGREATRFMVEKGMTLLKPKEAAI